MDVFYTPKKMGEKIKEYFWGFFLCGIMKVHNNKFFHDDKKKLKEKYTS
jgi:hypothetical protein